MDDDLLVGRYQRVRPLGSGGMGDVWLADDLDLGRQVAVKRLRVGGPAGVQSDLVERMLREARVVARLKHPAIVTLHDLVRVEGRPYLIMEFVEGESLADRIAREGRLPWSDAAQVVSDVADALAMAHRSGVLHRDVKPANVLLDVHGRGHLADFGIARGADDAPLTQAGELIGTVAYMPPEIARSEGATTASDIWSLGATFYAAVEGTAPFADSGSSVAAIIARLVQEPAPTPGRAGLATDLLERMLAADPSQRPYAVAVTTEIGELLAAPEAAPAPETRESTLPDRSWAAAETSLAAPPTGPPGSPASAGRTRWVVAAVGALLVAALVVGYLVLRDGDTPGGDDGPSSAGPGGGPDADPGAGPRAYAAVAVGAEPGRPVVTSSGTAYVAAEGGESVTRVGNDGEPLVIEVGAGPGALALSPDERFVYVPCDDGVSVIDTTTDRVRSVPFDVEARSLQPAVDGETLFVTLTDGDIAVVETDTLEITSVLPVGGNPSLVQTSPDGSTAYVPNPDAGQVAVIDVEERTLREPIDVPGTPTGLQVSADSERLYVTQRDGSVQVVDVATGDVEGIDVGGSAQGRIRLQDERYGWVHDPEAGDVHVLDLESGEVVETVDIDGSPGMPLVFTSDGTVGYVPDHDYGDVAVIDTATYQVAHRSVGESVQSLALSPDDSVLYATGHDDGDPEAGTLTAVALDD